MSGQTVVRLAIAFFIAAAAAGASTAQAQEVDCRFFKVVTDRLNMFSEPRGDAKFIDALNKNDIVCVAGDQKVGDRAWAYIAYQLMNQNKRKATQGWAIMGSLQPATQAELAAVRASEGSRPPAVETAPPAAPAPPAETVVRFSEPITTGPPPVNGQSLEQLITGVPLFPPIEGLDESVWKKHCDQCHVWTRQTLCVQANIYAKNPNMVFRIRHPYGGPEKIAMTKWAEGGCQ